jgi:AcrR family transcriptional regulator
VTSVKPHSSLRAEQAAQTRRRILHAAARVFEQQGFAGTRIEDVAIEAGVAAPTVYKVFTNKVNLLSAAVHQAMAGDDTAVIDEQAWFTEQLDEPDPLRQLQLIARNARRMYERAGQLLNVLHAAVPLDPHLAHAWHDVAAQRIDRSRRSAKSLTNKAASRLRLSRDDTALTLLALTEPELFTTYTAGNRTANQYEGWLADILCRSLLH